MGPGSNAATPPPPPRVLRWWGPSDWLRRKTCKYSWFCIFCFRVLFQGNFFVFVLLLKLENSKREYWLQDLESYASHDKLFTMWSHHKKKERVTKRLQAPFTHTQTRGKIAFDCVCVFSQLSRLAMRKSKPAFRWIVHYTQFENAAHREQHSGWMGLQRWDNYRRTGVTRDVRAWGYLIMKRDIAQRHR